MSGPLPIGGRFLIAVALLASACEHPAERELPHLDWRPYGHPEITLGDDGTVYPRWFGLDQPIGLCLDLPVELDTSRWRARLRFAGRPAGDFEPPRAQAGTTLCFGREPPADLPPTPRLEICGTVLDDYDESRYPLPCFTADYEADRGPFDARLIAARQRITAAGQDRERRIAGLDQMAAGLENEGFPALALSLRLVIMDELRREGTPAALERVRRRLDDLPSWLARPAAALPATKVAYERAMLELAEGRRRRAWQLLATAEDLARQVAASTRINVVARQAEILARMGAGDEPVVRLRTALAECDRWPCNRRSVSAAHDLLAWLLIIDPDAGDDQLEEAAANLAAADGADDAIANPNPRGRANRQLNAALLATRRGFDGAAELAAARSLLDTLEPDAEVHSLLAWANVIEGLGALATGDPGRAAELCRGVAGRAPTPRIVAWAWSCAGQAHRRRGELDAAADAFDRALLRHVLATPELGRDLALAPGRRVDDFYRAARLAIELVAPQRAWRILESLDRLAVDPVESCVDPARTRREIEARQQALLGQLAHTEPPLASDRRRQLEPVRRSLLQELEEVQRQALRGCRRRPSPTSARLRAFALDDEVLLLERGSSGRIATVRRTPLARRELRRLLEEIGAAQGAARLDDDAWRRLTRPLAAALLPDDAGALPAATGFALHGLLQRVPLNALPVVVGGKPRWFAELTAAVVRPALIETPDPANVVTANAAALFVIDPRSDLASARHAVEVYRRLFPEARLLIGADATRRAVRPAFAAADFVHFDAHGIQDPAFPQLSGLMLHDGLLTLADLGAGAWPRRLVNLSGCTTAGTMTRGDSGSGGLAGALAERGASWVVASRSSLEDRLAGDFNRAFYHRLAAGDGVPAAFRSALAAVRESHPAAAWSQLVLLGGGPPRDGGGQTTRPVD